MNDLKERLWEISEPSLYITKAQFFEWLEPWDIRPVEMEGEIAFITLQNGPVLHFHSLGTKHRITLRMIIDFLKPILARHGCAITKTPHGDARQHRFNKRFGFEAFDQDEFDVHYKIERLP